eukprot:CAMPEP_0182533318 /NCGR_PEP_ID=MMETSP1323-20130603/13573_1 /TAXON_ID=236787 /ORGANISM="Florenciella parvula, Strain RCC1693" /LENGTH=39 /DNA_ID= /DNA_START= /DNA_END= /DNA_ORIENTATION=
MGATAGCLQSLPYHTMGATVGCKFTMAQAPAIRHQPSGT